MYSYLCARGTSVSWDDVFHRDVDSPGDQGRSARVRRDWALVSSHSLASLSDALEP